MRQTYLKNNMVAVAAGREIEDRLIGNLEKDEALALPRDRQGNVATRLPGTAHWDADAGAERGRGTSLRSRDVYIAWSGRGGFAVGAIDCRTEGGDILSWF